MAGLLLWVVIITVWEAAQILSSSVEYLSTRLYNSSIVVGESRDSEWKNGGGRPKAPSEILEDRIHTVRINLLDDPSQSSGEITDGLVLPLEDGCRELMFPF